MKHKFIYKSTLTVIFFFVKNCRQGEDFGAELCAEWENAAREAEKFGTRVCLLRTGLVLSSNGGILGQMKFPFSLGLGGKIGSGSQWMSWIHIEDICRMIIYLLENENTQGVYNGVSPNPEKNIDFTKILKRVITQLWVMSCLTGMMCKFDNTF